MELGSRYDFGELLHVGGFDINDVEALVLYVQIPQVNPEVIAAYECFTVTVHGYAIYVIRMGVRICLSGHGGHDGVVVG